MEVSIRNPAVWNWQHGVCGLWFNLISQSPSNPTNLELGKKEQAEEEKKEKSYCWCDEFCIHPGMIVIINWFLRCLTTLKLEDQHRIRPQVGMKLMVRSVHQPRHPSF
jgi:hypothetical protein